MSTGEIAATTRRMAGRVAPSGGRPCIRALLPLLAILAAPAFAQYPAEQRRPFSAPLSATATRQTAVGSRVGANGQVSSGNEVEGAAARSTTRARTSQSLAALAPEAPVATAPLARASAPVAVPGKEPVAAKPAPKPAPKRVRRRR